MVDANHAYDAADAMRYARAVEDLDIAWFEEPVPPEDHAGYREVKAARRSRSPAASASSPAGASAA